GMRRGEILGLMWDDVNLETGVITVRKSKSGKPRTIPMNSFLLNELQQMKSESRKTSFLFTSPKTNQPFKTIRKAFGDACREAQILNFRFHDLRRTFGSRLALAGVDLNRIKELLGHASIKTTEIYLHADSSDIREAVEVLCPNHPGRLDNREHLLRICDTAKGGTKSKPVIPFYSSN
ncbi:MAG: site-specific integrase, partial [Candidatus Aminicenantaceae bacterium]